MKRNILITIFVVVCFTTLIHLKSYNNSDSIPPESGVSLAAEAYDQEAEQTSVARVGDISPAEFENVQDGSLNNNQTNRFGHIVVLESRTIPLEGTDCFRREQLIEAEFKYPMIRLEENMVIDSVTGEETILSQNAMVADHVMVKLNPAITENDLQQVVEKYGGSIRKKMYSEDLYLIAIHEVNLDALYKAVDAYGQEIGILAYAEPDYLVFTNETTPNDPDFPEQWGLHNTGQVSGTVDADIDATDVWDLATGSNNVLVAIIDTGIDFNHEDLTDNMWINPGEAGLFSTNGVDDDGNGLIDDYRGWNFAYDNNSTMDDKGHGTHCAGIIGGVGNNNIGISGVCWDTYLVGVKNMNSNGVAASSDTIDSIQYATQIGANVISASFGGTGYSAATKEAIDGTQVAGMLFVASAGNAGSDNDISPRYPCSYPNENIISVASSTRDDVFSSFSCYGAESVDIAAPGSSIFSTLPGNGYGNKSGTSMSAPCVSGAVALLWSHNPALRAIDVKKILLNTVDTNEVFIGKMVSDGRLNINNSIRNANILYLDNSVYRKPEWVKITLVNASLAGAGSLNVECKTDLGDSESVNLFETSSGSSIFTNKIRIAESGILQIENGELEAAHSNILEVVYANASLGITNSASAVVDLSLKITLTTSDSYIPYETSHVSVSGFNSWDAHADMVVSNYANGNTAFFSTTNLWTSPSILVTNGENLICVSGTNLHGLTDSAFVTLIRRGPAGITNYVATSGSHAWPYLSWNHASTNIQAAVDAAAIGNYVVVSNGVYNSGGRVAANQELMSRVCVQDNITLQSLNGAENTVIEGNPDPVSGGLGKEAVRCVYLGGGSIEGFTLRYGHTLSNGSSTDHRGGGIAATVGAVVRNCIFEQNRSSYSGGGLLKGTAYNCLFSHNESLWGGGVGGAAIYNCVVVSNVANNGGGINNTKAFNSIIYYNDSGDINLEKETFSCLSPDLAHGVGGNLTNAPLFIDADSGNYRLQASSPCINGGENVYMADLADLDGNIRIVGPRVDVGAYEFQYEENGDEDGDGLSNGWELEYFGNIVNAGSADDNDSDQSDNLSEYISGTDPTNPASVFAVTNFSPTASFVLEWSSVAERYYSILWSTNLVSGFSLIATNIAYPQNSYTDTMHNAESEGFYKVGVFIPSSIIGRFESSGYPGSDSGQWVFSTDGTFSSTFVEVTTSISTGTYTYGNNTLTLNFVTSTNPNLEGTTEILQNIIVDWDLFMDGGSVFYRQ